MSNFITLLYIIISCLILRIQGFGLFARFFKKFATKKIFPELSLVRLNGNKYPNAKCLDGSFGAYYISRPYKILGNFKIRYTSNIWAFYLEGGGLCFDNTTCSTVSLRIGINFTSSTQFTPTFNNDGYGWISRNCNENPDFCKVNLVYVPYCSQDTYNGERIKPVTFTAPFNFIENDNGDWYFSGKFIIRAIIDDIKQKTNIEKADLILFGGISAGGYAILTNIDDIQELLPNTIVKGFSTSGWNFPGDYNNSVKISPVFQDILSFNDPNINQNLFVSFEYLISLYNAFNVLPIECVPLFGLNCGSTDVLIEYIKSPIFIAEYNIDSSFIADFTGASIFGAISPESILTDIQKEYVFYYADNLLQSLSQINITRNGYFIANCFDHVFGIRVGEPNNVAVNGITITDIFGNWFFNRNNNRQFVIIDDCFGINCNPQCRFPPQ